MESDSPTALTENDLNNNQPVANRRCEEWLCSICMDYLINAVKTGCSHKFCSFCLNRWMTTNPVRKCPICRSDIGGICPLPELDIMITNSLQEILSPEEISQRHNSRVQRECNAATANDPWLQNETSSASLPSQLVSQALFHSMRNAELEAHLQLQNVRLVERGENLRNAFVDSLGHQSQISNPWATRSTSTIVNNLRESINLLNGFRTAPIVTPNQLAELAERRVRFLREGLGSLSRSRTLTMTTPMTNEIRPTVHSAPSEELHETLAVDYYNHLGAAEDAYIRIQQAERDLSYHNQRLRSIYREFVLNFPSHLNLLGQRPEVIRQEVPVRDSGRESRRANASSRSNRQRQNASTRARSDPMRAENEESESGFVTLFRQLSRVAGRYHHPPPSRDTERAPVRPLSPNRISPESFGFIRLSELYPSVGPDLSESVSSSLRVTREELHLPQQDTDNISSPNIETSVIGNVVGTEQGRSSSRRRNVQFANEGLSAFPDHEISRPNGESRYNNTSTDIRSGLNDISSTTSATFPLQLRNRSTIKRSKHKHK